MTLCRRERYLVGYYYSKSYGKHSIKYFVTLFSVEFLSIVLVTNRTEDGLEVRRNWQPP